ncbi:MAG: ATPase [Cyclobacteriaceae bacterium]|nr:MAG: ATPase [Cyclobacteriaceae bacterium]
MAQASGYDEIIEKLRGYKRKYYQNQLIKGALLAVGILCTSYLVVNSLEYTLRFGSVIRAILFFGFIALIGWAVYHWILEPVWKLITIKRQISDEVAARQIGKYFPNIGDKLLNTLQLHRLSVTDNALIQASIDQKSNEVVTVRFAEAINFSENRKYLKYLLFPMAVVVIILFAAPQMFTESTPRLINYKKTYAPVAPFQFKIINQDLTAFKNEDFSLQLGFTGTLIPNTVYLQTKDRKIKMLQNQQGNFEYTFSKVQSGFDFQFEAAGFQSDEYALDVYSRPNLKSFDINLKYPKYLQRQDETLQNTGNLQIPEGTAITWIFKAFETDQVTLKFEQEKEAHELQKTDNQTFTYSAKAKTTDRYSLDLKNSFSNNKEEIQYQINVIKDKFPEITLDQFRDTTMFSYMIFGGNISDDYGLSRLSLFYSLDDSEKAKFNRVPIPIKTNTNNQNYYFQWDVDSLGLTLGDQVAYYLKVWDNDGVNGAKGTKTALYSFKLPSRQQINESLDESSKNTQDQIDKSLQDAKELNTKIKDVENRLKSKKTLDWQDKKLLEEILEKKEELSKELDRLKQQNEKDNAQKQKFNEYSESLKTKIDQLQDLMNELLDEETKKLYDELRKLLDEKQDYDSFQDLLEQLDYKEQNLEEELERTLELFKRMQFEQDLEETIQDLQEIKEDQQELLEDTGDKQQETENLSNKQQQLKEDFQDLQKDIEELREKNQDLDNSEMFDDTSEEEQEIEKGMEQSQQQLQDNKRKPSEKSQKQSIENMQQLNQKLQQMQSSMEMEMMQENLDNLRDIEDNLIKLSFDQESLMKDFQKLNQSDPRFIELSQQQLKLKDDAKIIEDSLISLANRVYQIKSFVTREVKEMNDHMDESLDGLKKRNQSQSLSNQQLTMTSINNLALLLGDVLQQMQQQMAMAQGGKPKQGKKNTPGLSQLQQQLNQQIENLKKSGKSGRALSEELAKLAAQQEMIRRALEEAEQGIKELGDKGKGNEEIIEKMEQTETDLVNKQITTETIKRQKEILTRLLEAEKSIRERELDKAREAQHASKKEPSIPPEFKEYLKAKEKEVELLRTVPPKLNPYYKQEVNEYFKRLDN